MPTPRTLKQAFSTRILFFLLVGLVGVLYLFFSVQTNTSIAHLNTPIHEWFAAHRTEQLTSIMAGITHVLSPTVIAVTSIAGALYWITYKKEVWRPMLFIGALGFTFVVSGLLKGIVQEARPPQALMVLPVELDFSFPSGHTIGVAVAALVLMYLFCLKNPKRPRFILWLTSTIAAITIIAISRLYLGYHWLTDVAASVFLALIILAVVVIVDRLKPSRIP